jgi:3-methyladenine DNA glycosylase AlkD
MRSRQVVDELRSLAAPAALEGMARFGINTNRAMGGISVPTLRAMARRIGRDHHLAQELWATEIHEARLLASMIDDPDLVTNAQMETWAAGFDSWDVTDACCGNLFDRTPFAYTKALEWSVREEEFVKRAAFSLIATLAVHDREAPDPKFEGLLAVIERESRDGRNFVKKAVNWALRSIGKRNLALNAAAVASAERIRGQGSPSARWIATDALRELRSDAVLGRLRRKEAAPP